MEIFWKKVFIDFTSLQKTARLNTESSSFFYI